MSRCLVLGGAGFLGSHMSDALLRAGHDVVIFARAGRDRGDVRRVVAGAEWVEGDFATFDRFPALLEGIDVVFHCIGTTLPKTSNDDPIYDISSNVFPTLRLLAAASAGRARKVVFLSSGGTIYGVPRAVPITEEHPTDPVCSYGIQKLAIEKYLKLYEHMCGLRYAIMRISNPFGERQRPVAAQGAVSVFLYKALRRERIEIWGDGSVVRDYIHVSDVARAAVALAGHDGSSRVFNVGSGAGSSLLDVIRAIEKVVGRALDVDFRPPRPFDVPVNVLDVSRAASELSWRPLVSFEEGLRRTMASLVASESTSRP